MHKHSKQNFFLKNGKKLTHYVQKNLMFNQTPKEVVASIALPELVLDTLKVKKQSRFSKLFNFLTKRNIKDSNKLMSIAGFDEPTKGTKSLYKNLKKLEPAVVKKVWISSSLASFAVLALVVSVYPMKVYPQIGHKYSIYAATPLRLGSTEYQVYSRDARSQKINQVFKEFRCPLEGMGEVFVYEADRNNIPWWLVAAISFQESSCGKMTPEPQGIESYNAWGWAVYGDTVQSFDNWARGIETVSEYMHEKFFAKGITEPCDIMKTYTPPSKGSWCEGVKHFGDLIQNYESPDDNT